MHLIKRSDFSLMVTLMFLVSYHLFIQVNLRADLLDYLT